LNIKTDPRSLYINKNIPPNSKLIVYLEDKSGFNMDIKNFSNDTLIIRTNNFDNLFVSRKKTSIRIEPNSITELINSTKRDISFTVRIYNHKSKIIHGIYALEKN
jgi:hypothetical protein